MPTPTERATHALEDSGHVGRGTPSPWDTTQQNKGARVTPVITGMNPRGLTLKAGGPGPGPRCDSVSMTLQKPFGWTSLLHNAVAIHPGGCGRQRLCAVFWGSRLVHYHMC